MTRRDIIIIAVLANLAVLAILFMLAFRTQEEIVEEPEIITYAFEEEPSSKPEEKPEVEVVKQEPLDEVDALIGQLNLRNQEEPEEELEPEPIPETFQDNFAEVIVKSGDALEKIAKANGTSVDAIMNANNLKNDRLKIGQVLRIPLSQEAPKEMTQENNIQYYTIKSGDNPWKIAKQFHVKVDELLILNKLDEDRARKLKAGDQIRIK